MEGIRRDGKTKNSMKIPNNISISLLTALIMGLHLGNPTLAQSGETVTDVPRIIPNDNRIPAGRLDGGVLTVRLEARDGMWHPHGPDRDGILIGAFAEDGSPLQIPGPLIRVTIGTEVRTTMRNALGRSLTIFGLGADRGFSGEGVLIEPGDSAAFTFTAHEPGTYYYVGQTDHRRVEGAPLNGSLHGAIVVDPPGIVISPGDRVLVISSWFSFDYDNFSHLSDDAVLTINGLAWPHTDVVEVTQGDSLDWRWINMTDLDHPMHLHGFHFRVDAKGNGVRDTIYSPEERWHAVTEYVPPAGTVSTLWSPDRPGNWLFHCHMLGHMTAIEVINTPVSKRAALHDGVEHLMGMLIVGIRVRPSGPRLERAVGERLIRLLIRSRPDVYGENTGYAYVLGGSPEEAKAEALPLPGPTLALTRGERVAIRLINDSHEPGAVHWHGIELDSYADGVPGWSGEGDRILPAIPPGDSLTVQFTPPRAGTFMYHSHFNEMQQTSSGLYGPIVVLEPGEEFDPETDRVLVFSDGGPWSSFTPHNSLAPPTFLNGRPDPSPLHLKKGITYRFRLINILTESSLRMALLRDGEPVSWRALAKDGADLPPSLAAFQPAQLTFMPGEIRDFAFTPDEARDLILGFGKGAPWDSWTPVTVHVH